MWAHSPVRGGNYPRRVLVRHEATGGQKTASPKRRRRVFRARSYVRCRSGGEGVCVALVRVWTGALPDPLACGACSGGWDLVMWFRTGPPCMRGMFGGSAGFSAANPGITQAHPRRGCAFTGRCIKGVPGAGLTPPVGELGQLHCLLLHVVNEACELFGFFIHVFGDLLQELLFGSFGCGYVLGEVAVFFG